MYNLTNRITDDTAVLQVNKEYQIYFLLVVFLISLQLICNTIEPIIFIFSGFKIPASALFYVFSFAVCDIITENFGFKLAVRATILNVIAQLTYCGIATMVILIPKEYQADSSHASESFQYIFHFLSLELLSSILSLLISMVTNDYLINKLKLIFLGKGFWWRTIISTILGEIVMLNIDYNITFLDKKNLIEIQHLIFNAMSYKVLAALFLAFPSAILSSRIGKNLFFLKPNMNQKTRIVTELKNAVLFR
jgi:uncharacterized integral membrane protein (TIGR00697 family)